MAYDNGNRHVGKDFTPPDIEGKVTGAAKYSEDFRAEGMVFAKLLTSPMPHAKVRSIDTSEAAKMDGVLGFITADEVPEQPTPRDPILTNEPLFVGQPIMAVAAVTEEIAANAIDAIKLDLQPLPFTVDPLDAVFPGGDAARTDFNSIDAARRELKTVNWTAQDFLALQDGQLPLGEPSLEWEYGDLTAGFAKAKLVLEESFVMNGSAHNSMEPRSSMAYWQNGKLFLHGSTQSSAFGAPAAARYTGTSLEELVYISEYCGGGFGSKGSSYPIMSLSAHFSKKLGRPVMLRITREEEYHLGVGRPGFQGRAKMGFGEDGRVTAVDLYILHDNGPNRGGGDFRSASGAVSIIYQPEAMHFRGLAMLTNTQPRGAQRGPGECQIAAALEPIVDKAARQLGIDRVALRSLNAPGMDGKIANRTTGKLGPLTSSRLPEAIAMGAEKFGWASRSKQSGKRNGTKVTGLGVGSCYHGAGSSGFDGLLVIQTDGRVNIHTGAGNLGTYSYAGTSRASADVLDVPWEQVTLVRGASNRHLPWSLGQFGSNTSMTMARQAYVSAMDAKTKLQEIAAKDLGGAPGDYELKDGTVVGNGKSMTFAQAAKRAIELGGKYDGHEAPEDLNKMTAASVKALAGTGLVGVAKDSKKKGTTPGLCVAFVEIELDTETGKYDIVKLLNVGDVGQVLHPQGLSQQLLGGAVHGLGSAMMERHVYDPKLGMAAHVGMHNSRLPTYLDVALDADWAAPNIPDPSNPVGSKGVGEPAMGSAWAALLCAISDAMGGHSFNHTPITPDMIVNAAAGRPQSTELNGNPLQQNAQ